MSEIEPFGALKEFSLEEVDIADLKPHPRNYRHHPEDQLQHLMASIEKHGMYRNIVIAREGTILAGHGVVEAAARLGRDTVPVHRVDVPPNDVRALEILTGDNEVDHLGVVDDRALTELLKEIKIHDVDGLLGTGYDESMLANLAMITRPKSEIRDHNEAAHWVGLPEYEEEPLPVKIVITFEDEDAREVWARQQGMEFLKREQSTWVTRWPFEGRDDRSSIKFDDWE